jgi:hypothetical protein
VRSDLPFTYLRDGRATASLDVRAAVTAPPTDRAPMLEWLPRPEHPFHARLFDAGNGDYDVWIDGMGTYHVTPGAPAVTVPDDAEPVRREERLWGIPAALCFTRRGDLPLHAAAVEIGDRAVLLAAPGRFGKTTLAAAFLARGHRVLAEDLVCLRARGGAAPVLLPGPAVLRVRRDVYDRLGPIAGTRPVADDPERVHLALDDHLRGSGDPVPIAGLVLLRRDAPEVRLEPADATELLADLWTVSFNLPTDEDRVRCFEGIVDLAGAVPTWTLDRPLSFETLPEVLERVEAIAR